MQVELQNWEQARLGAGGYMIGLEELPGSKLFAWSDVHGLYVWDDRNADVSKQEWLNLIRESRFPANEYPRKLYGITDGEAYSSDSGGVYAFALSPSNLDVGYLAHGGYVYKTSNARDIAAMNFVRTGFARNQDMNSNSGSRILNTKIAVDPRNENRVLLSLDEGGGVWLTENGGTSWTQLSVPDGKLHGVIGGYAGCHGIYFDPASAAIGAGPTIKTSTVCVYTVNDGLYISSDGGVAFARSTGGPTGPRVKQYANLTVGTTALVYPYATVNQVRRTRAGVTTTLTLTTDYTVSGTGNSRTVTLVSASQTGDVFTIHDPAATPRVMPSARWRNGKLWALFTDSSASLRSLQMYDPVANSWTDKTPVGSFPSDQPAAIDINPNDANTGVLQDQRGRWYELTFTGDNVAFGALNEVSVALGSSPIEPPWQFTLQELYMATGSIRYARNAANVRYFAHGLGVSEMTRANPAAATQAWVTKSRGIENMVMMYVDVDDRDNAYPAMQDRQNFRKPFDKMRRPMDIYFGFASSPAIVYGRRPKVHEASGVASFGTTYKKDGFTGKYSAPAIYDRDADTYSKFTEAQLDALWPAWALNGAAAARNPLRQAAEFVVTRKQGANYSGILIPLTPRVPNTDQYAVGRRADLPLACMSFTADTTNGIVGTWTPCTLTQLGPGTFVDQGITYNYTGGPDPNGFHPWEGFNLMKACVTQDFVNPAKVEMLHTAGLYTNDAYGDPASWVLEANSAPPVNSFWGSKFKAVPFIEDARMFVYGPEAQTPSPGFWVSYNRGRSWQSLQNASYAFTEVIDYSFGPKVPGKNYPIVRVLGVIVHNNVASYSGVFRSEDFCATWIQECAGWPGGLMDACRAVASSRIHKKKSLVVGGGTGLIGFSDGAPAGSRTLSCAA